MVGASCPSKEPGEANGSMCSGLRPGRHGGIRIERDHTNLGACLVSQTAPANARTGDDTPLIHAYGHAGAGMSFAFLFSRRSALRVSNFLGHRQPGSELGRGCIEQIVNDE